LNQSTFALRAGIFTKKKHMGRDLVSNWILGKSEPSPLYQIAMAKALGITVDELMAPIDMVPAKEKVVAAAPVEMREVSPNRVRLQINMEMSKKTAAEIISLIYSVEK
jgi:transcriptional regulator with XRE-family HTH domain